MRVARPAGQAAPPQVDGRTGLGPALAVRGRRAGRPVVVVVVDLWPPGVRGDDPSGGAPLLQGVRRFDALLDLVAARPEGAVRLDQALPWKTARALISPCSFLNEYIFNTCKWTRVFVA